MVGAGSLWPAIGRAGSIRGMGVVTYPLEPLDVRAPGVRYADDLMSLAFQWWAFRFNRNSSDCARALLADWSQAWGAPPNEAALGRAIRKHADTEQWSTKVRAAISAIAPDVDTQIIANNLRNALKASIVMGEVFDRKYSASDGRTLAYAAKIAYESAGYDAASMLERIKEASANRGAEFNPAALAQLSPDELADRADRIRRGLPLDVPSPASTTDDISPHSTVVDNSDSSPPDADPSPPAAADIPSPSPSYADGRDSSGKEVVRWEAESQGCPKHDPDES